MRNDNNNGGGNNNSPPQPPQQTNNSHQNSPAAANGGTPASEIIGAGSGGPTAQQQVVNIFDKDHLMNLVVRSQQITTIITMLAPEIRRNNRISNTRIRSISNIVSAMARQ
jgi:hypothetical protein